MAQTSDYYYLFIFFSKSTPKPLKKLTVDPSSLLLSEICNTPVGVIQDEYSSEWQRIFRFSILDRTTRVSSQNFLLDYSVTYCYGSLAISSPNENLSYIS